MQKLSYVILLFVLSTTLFSQTSPHGDNLKIDCNVCHTTEGWGLKNSKFDHGTTDFELIGQHKSVRCISCHTDLHFDEAETTCESCHTDIHENSVGFDCERCHTPESWLVSDVEDIHRMSRFPLLGAHKTADCNECHISNTHLNFKPLGATCYDCHMEDYQATTSPNHIASNYSTDCDECHSINSPTWSGAGIVHSFFSLTGGHEILDCYQCHSQNSFEGLTQECSSCHIDDYNSTTNPSHISLGFSTDCNECHTIQGWQPATFDHDAKFFPIYSGEHNDEWNECSDCHTNSSNYADFSCLNCHEHNQTDMNEEHGGINGYSYESNACFACHPTGSEEGSFSHTQAFPLVGAHSNVSCSDCHATTYSNTSSECVACHKTNYDNAQNPNHQTLVLSQQCELCHTATSWTPSTFNHTTTGFELLGSHATVNCSDCHESNVANAVQDCFACHENEYNSAPNHLTQNYPKECETCHNSVTWIETTFDHNTTNFPLTGAHINSDCSSCHASGYTNISAECSSCHQTDYDGTVNPSHQALGLSTNCETCHTTNIGWAPAEFPDHNNYFELLGAHATIANNCADCHNNDYNNTSSDCFSCHSSDYNNTTNPSHSATQFPTTCDDCHSVNAWTPATFDHDNRFFPIYSGEHKDEWNECSDCHTNSNDFSVFSCTNCHEHNQTDMNSEHSGVNGYVYESNACYTCHPTGSEDGSFSHTQSFPLTGSHSTATCSDCHTSTYSNTSSECVACHQTEFESTQNPNHKTLVLSEQCELCHTATDWTPSTFSHATTGFELLGNHATVSCSDCHESNVTNAVQDCFACHEDNYNNAPDHLTQSYPKECETCHNSVAWNETTFDHNTTNFPLTGAHINSDCSSCHASGYTNVSTECSSCHQSNFDNTTNPSHQTLGLSNDCAVCHTTNPGWAPAEFPEHNNYFELLGAHAAIANNCVDCHNNDYNNTSSDCFSCHETDYNNTSNPSHSAAQFPTTCDDCHSVNAWTPATFDHDNKYFPIYSGEHKDKWAECSECHTTQNNYSVFSCIDCHEHNQTDMNSEHSDVNGYVYESNACYTCHPNGSEDGSFSHTSAFPLIGSHSNVTCSNCHVTTYANTSSECVSCHETNYDNTTSPNHKTLLLSEQCEVCHTVNSWTPSTFDHKSTGFGLLGSHTSASCSDCHTTDVKIAVQDCFNCHEDKYNNAPNHLTQMYPKECETCHNTVAWSEATFDHSTTKFPLTGAHINSNCNSCHASGYTNVSTECSSCHQSNFDNTTNPSHKTLGLSTDCTLCHTTNPGWAPAKFPDHNNYFELLGAHATISNNCADCHNSDYNNTSSDCFSCHETNYNNATSPNHKTLLLSEQCGVCHTVNSWTPSTFDHKSTGFELLGSHTSVSCSDCHTADVKIAVQDCFNCHEDKYNNAPNHLTQMYPKECETCHNTVAWSEATFDHNTTKFPLTGAHINSNCNSCHASGYTNVSTECSSCHQSNFDNTTNPSHKTLGLSTECVVCHSTKVGWAPAEFPDHSNYFELLGAHATIANSCADCHNGDYNNTLNTCFGCHETDYNNTTNPSHSAAQFPTTCDDCHTSMAWIPATFDHDSKYFPIYSGKHKGEWTACSDCHTTQNNYSLFSCIDCHEHNQTEMNSEHSGVSGYVYESTACLSCHPNGTEGDGGILELKINKAH